MAPPSSRLSFDPLAIQFQTCELAFVPERSSSAGTLRVEITDPFGDVRWREGFPDGGVWRVRWTPLEAGPHHLRFETDLDGLPESLGVVATPPAPSAFGFDHEASSHGPVRIADDRLRFSRADGLPFFLKCDHALHGPLRATDAEWAYYARRRREQGFSAVLLGPGDPTLLDRDGCPDVRSMAELDRRIATLNAAGLAAIVRLPRAESGTRFDHVVSIRFARHAVARWGAGDVLWLLTGGFGSGDAAAEIAETIAYGRAVFGDDPWRAPVGAELGEDGSLHADLENEPWLGWLALSNEAGMSRVEERARRPRLVLSPPGEIRPDGTYDPTAHLRRAALGVLFAAPPAGIGYAADGISEWRSRMRPSPDAESVDPRAPEWSESLGFPGAEIVGRIEHRLSRHSWSDLEPAPQLVEPARDAPPNGVLADPMRERIRLYLPSGGELRLLLPERSYEAYWAFAGPERRETRLGVVAGTTTVRAPDDGDWILELDAEDAF